MIQPQEIRINCVDQFSLAATLYVPETYKAAVMIAPATGINRSFYNSFATYLAENNFGVITFNNRGIGDSLHEVIKRSNISLQDWGAIDMPAVLQQLQKSFPNTTYHLIGHSNGGQLCGLMSNAPDLTSLITVCSSTGNLSGMKFPYVAKAYFFLKIFIPLSNFLFGHAKIQWLDMGEPLPKNVAKQWAKWCAQKGYIESAFGHEVTHHNYHTLIIPALWIATSDDPIAPQTNVINMMKVYNKMSSKIIVLNPIDYGIKEIGHMKFFSKKNQLLWPLAKNWLVTYCK